ncbi:MAG: diacylglycerol O-acyltransferase / wax synthase [Thermoleophilaceae bacterium]|jgi:WS/DGAT/MGAT family acyltransferase|nr:diacylglycerol O-acyltransferase / wax synthase [Thermoleophilaceae bacterium]
MANDRLTGLDTSFLHLEDDSAHMHVGAVMIFEGAPPHHEEVVEGIRSRLHLVPRYRQKLAFVPLGQGRPRWVDDPHFNLNYHVRHTALPEPGTEDQLKRLAGRVFSQRLDRDKPLWEMWVVEGLDGGDRFAVLSKTHHALVDGVSGIDIMSILFDTKPEPDAPPPAEEKRWLPAPTPSGAQLLAEALFERATVPAEIARGARALVRGPRRIAGAALGSAAGVGSMVRAGLSPAPKTPYNERIGPHRRFTWVRMQLADVKSIKNSLGGTVNDVMLATVAGALGRHLRRRGVDVTGLELKAMVPVSVRSEEARGALGNQVAAMMAPLPVGLEDPVERMERISDSMAHLKSGGQAVGAQVLTELTGFAPPNIMSQAARVVARQRMFNLVVTNVPGPQFALYMMGRKLEGLFPMVPLAPNQALGVAIMSYNGTINFGLVGDFDLMADLDDLADDLHAALAELADAAGVEIEKPKRTTRRARRRQPAGSNGHKPGRRIGSTSTVTASGDADE